MKHDNIIERIDLMVFLERMGVEGKISGRNFTARCPFPDHEDRSPSFAIALEGKSKGLWNCFGCGSQGNIIHFVQRKLDLDRTEAEEWLAKEFGLDKIIYTPSTEEISKLLADQAERVEEDMIIIPLPRPAYDTAPAMKYMADRRGYSKEKAENIFNHFGMAYCAEGYYKERIIIPIYDSTGKQATFEACAVNHLAEKRKLYPKGSPMARLLFNHSKISSSHTWVVEGLWDAIRLWSFGEPAIATFGAHMSVYQARMIISKYSDVFLLYDGDEAGYKAGYDAYERLKPYVNVYRAELAFGDPDELKNQEFKELIKWLKK